MSKIQFSNVYNFERSVMVEKKINNIISKSNNRTEIIKIELNQSYFSSAFIFIITKSKITKMESNFLNRTNQMSSLSYVMNDKKKYNIFHKE